MSLVKNIGGRGKGQKYLGRGVVKMFLLFKLIGSSLFYTQKRLFLANIFKTILQDTLNLK